MATQSKYPDVPSYTAVPTPIEDRRGRDVARRVTCDFVASGSGSYFSRSCHNLAAWVRVYRHDDGTVTTTSDLRCHRHRAIDERTAANRGWGKSDYDPFDGQAVAKRLIREAQAEVEEARLKALSEKVVACAAYILAHADLTADQMDALTSITTETVVR